MSLHDVLVRLHVTQYEPKLIEEAIDLRAATLLSPSDMRIVIGMPLGLAAKLIHAAQESYGEQRREVPSAFPLISTPEPTRVEQADSEFELEELLQAKHDGPLRGGCDICCSVFCSAWTSAWKAGTCIKDLLFPPDHQINFWRQAIVARSSAELKWILMNNANGWVILFGFFLTASVSIWNLVPPYAAPLEKLLFEGAMSVSVCFYIATPGIFLVYSVCLDTVSVSNTKAFLTASLGGFAFLQKSLVASFYLLVASLMAVSYMRMKTVLSSSVELRMHPWQLIFRCAIPMAMVIYVTIMFGLAMMFGRLAHNGCLMCERNRFPEQPSASSMEKVFSSAVLEQVHSYPRCDAPVNYAFESKSRGGSGTPQAPPRTRKGGVFSHGMRQSL